MSNREPLNLDYGHVKSDAKEGKMFVSTLETIIRKCEDLADIIHHEDDMPQWCHYKLAKASEKISSLHDYLTEEVNMEREEPELDSCAEEGIGDFKDIFSSWNSFVKK